VFLTAIKNTLFFVLVGVPVKNLLAMLIALLLFSIGRGSNFFRLAAFLPVIVPPLATILLYQYLFHFHYGPLNQALVALGLGRVPWLTSAAWVKPSLILMVVWNSVGYPTIILLAGLGTIPEVLREAAMIDGASGLQVFWRIILPLMRRPLAFVLVTDTIDWLQLFTEPQVLTAGGPADHSLTAVMLIRNVGLTQFRMGAASALAFVLFLIIAVVALVQLRVLRTSWEY
jgi:multiple sugar transport system permease protein